MQTHKKGNCLSCTLFSDDDNNNKKKDRMNPNIILIHYFKWKFRNFLLRLHVSLCDAHKMEN